MNHSHLHHDVWAVAGESLTAAQRAAICAAVEGAYRRGFAQAAWQAREAVELGEATPATMRAWHQAVDAWRYAARTESPTPQGYWKAPPEHWQCLPKGRAA